MAETSKNLTGPLELSCGKSGSAISAKFLHGYHILWFIDRPPQDGGSRNFEIRSSGKGRLASCSANLLSPSEPMFSEPDTPRRTPPGGGDRPAPKPKRPASYRSQVLPFGRARSSRFGPRGTRVTASRMGPRALLSLKTNCPRLEPVSVRHPWHPLVGLTCLDSDSPLRLAPTASRPSAQARAI